MHDNPLALLLMIAATVYVAKLWLDDLNTAKKGSPNPRALPGATSPRLPAILLAALGALLLLGAETWGEEALGLTEEQSRMTVLFGIYTLSAAFIEELIFRGFLVIDKKGPALLWGGILGASILFATLHPYLWSWQGLDKGGLHLVSTPKAWFSTSAIFAGSLWFYIVRFWPLNPTHSLWPCITAHAVKNLGVFAIKYAQGFVDGGW